MSLWLKVRVSFAAPVRKIAFFDGDRIRLDLSARYDPAGAEMYADVTPFAGLRLEAECPCELTDSCPPRPAEGRPKTHFTAPRGWNNDPNGCVFDGENWHLFYQHNPVGVDWGNMHWGHAVTKDLVRFTDAPTVLWPDEHGAAYSGSAWIDRRNDAGFGAGAMLLYYTAAGNADRVSAGRPYTQRLAVSTDGGMTFTKVGEVIGHVAGENRDPKIVRDERAGVYRLALYLTEDRYALFTSRDLKNFEKKQELRLPGDNECPDLFPLETGEGTKWVLMGAHDKYYVGEFREDLFVPLQGVRSLHYGNRAYAAQSFNGLPGGRRVRVSWCQGTFPGAAFNCSMTTPAEMTLRPDAEGWALCLAPCAEWLAAGGEAQTRRFTLPVGGSLRLDGAEVRVEETRILVNGFACPRLPGEDEPRFTLIGEPNAVEVYVGEGDRFFCVDPLEKAE